MPTKQKILFIGGSMDGQFSKSTDLYKNMSIPLIPKNPARMKDATGNFKTIKPVEPEHDEYVCEKITIHQEGRSEGQRVFVYRHSSLGMMELMQKLIDNYQPKK